MITILPLPFLRNHGKILIFGSGKIFKGAKPTSVIDQRLRRTLVDSLYSNPMSLLIGALCGVLVCAYTAYVSDDEALPIVASRVGFVYGEDPNDNKVIGWTLGFQPVRSF